MLNTASFPRAQADSGLPWLPSGLFHREFGRLGRACDKNGFRDLRRPLWPGVCSASDRDQVTQPFGPGPAEKTSEGGLTGTPVYDNFARTMNSLYPPRPAPAGFLFPASVFKDRECQRIR